MKKFNLVYDEENCAVMPDDYMNFKIENIITSNDKMLNILETCQRIAVSDAPILITGDSGVGKELLAELVHNSSNRKKEQFVKINCAAIPDNLKESVFFGYEAGSFTGASKYGKKGLFELSQNGTLFMDEIGEMPLSLQSTLLRVLQDGKFIRVGGYKEIRSNIRIISATNKDLRSLVNEGHFRNDLFFRLNVIPITIPSLFERQDDIPLLALYFTNYFNIQYNTSKRLSKSLINALISNEWTGNIRELKNTIERLVLISLDNVITIEDLRYVGSINKKTVLAYCANQDIHDIEIDRPLKQIIEEFELDILKRSVEKHGSIRKAAKVLDVTPSTISRKLSKNN